MRLAIFLLLTCTCSSIFAQVGIGTSTPASSAILDVTTTLNDKGILIPRVNIIDLNTQDPITGIMEESLLVYNTNVVSGKGFYYWDGIMWQPFNTSDDGNANNPDPTLFWNTTGNSGTDANQNYLGTSDNTDFIIATNTRERIRVKNNGNIGINEINPDQLLHINTSRNGQGIKIARGNNNSEITQTGRDLNYNSSSTAGSFSYSFFDDKKIIIDNNRLYPAVNSLDNTNTTGYDLGMFNQHFRRIYSQAIHTNDNDADGGLRINIGSQGGTDADYIFSDFAHFPVLDGAKDLGRNGNSWNNLYFQNAFRTSDIRKKKNIQPLKDGLTSIIALNTYQYNYKNDNSNRLQYGFIAQELQEQIPSIVDEGLDSNKSLAVDYGQMIPILVKAIQEQQVKIEALQQEVQLLKNNKS
ncbi:tail fiber domain-containing protein [uncultured Nonlabens sp.]|uniref:tail fiber domain-containing protein n=1 Tax=uncultured Nonlabens sp. TaxID=859306 RepID=UPI00261D8F43|nr:tail fiber domain-containing protein [uncultured Nonlabens sp.]